MTSTRHFHHFRAARWLGAGALLALGACGGGSDNPTTGVLRLALTDAPSCGFDNVWVTVDSVRVHQSASALDNDPGWVVVRMSDMPRRIDLLSLTNGVLQELGQATLPAGTYTQMRLVLSDAGMPTMPAHEVRLTGGGNAMLSTPSAMQSGLKLKVNLKVEPGQLADFVLDFDACRSVVTAGASGRFNLKPVVSVLPRITTGMAVDGFLSQWTPYTTVSIQSEGRVLRSTVPAPSGYFVLPYLPTAGTAFDLVVSTPDRGTQVVTGVPVTVDGITRVGHSERPIVLAPSATQGVQGKVTSGTTVPEAIVAALQTVATGRQVEVASRSVDSADGSYALTLPTVPVQVAPYVAQPAVLAFTPYAASTARYTLRSRVPGKADALQEVNLNTGPATVDFTH